MKTIHQAVGNPPAHTGTSVLCERAGTPGESTTYYRGCFPQPGNLVNYTGFVKEPMIVQ